MTKITAQEKEPRKKNSRSVLKRSLLMAIHQFLDRDQVTGVDLGYKYVSNERTKEVVVRIHVKEKIGESFLAGSEIIPSHIESVATDVIEAVYTPSYSDWNTHNRRIVCEDIQPGISVSNLYTTAGTLGLIVHDLDDDQLCILSNWHVLVGPGAIQPGDPIVQPGRNDGGSDPENTIAKLRRWMLNSRGDAAIAELLGNRPVNHAQFESGTIIHSHAMPRRGQLLYKSGRTTGVTLAKVDGKGKYKVEFQGLGEKEISGFRLVPRDPRRPREISAEGDSGAIWATQDGVGVGLHLAGEKSGNPADEHAIACFLPWVMKELNVDLKPQANGS